MKYKPRKDNAATANNHCMTFIYLLFSYILGIVSFYFIQKHHEQSLISYQTSSISISDSSNNIESSSRQIVTPLRDSYWHQDMIQKQKQFDLTLRNCLGSACFDEPVNGIDRIGVLAPPHGGNQAISQLLQLLSESIKHKVNIIPDTHAPAYGYGKNHGWTRIIRFSRRLIDHSHAIYSQASNENLKFLTQELVRWHCRVSHVAAHTKLLTIFIEDLLELPIVEVEKMLSFVGVKVSRADIYPVLNKLWPTFLEEIKHVSSDHNRYQDKQYEAISYGIGLELNSTKDLTRWPCPSFRLLIKEVKDESFYMIPSQVLAVNCSDSYVTCEVHYDQNGG